MPAHIRKHEAVKDTGSFEVWFDDERPSGFFYFEDDASRRLRSEQLTRAQALEAAKVFARRHG